MSEMEGRGVDKQLVCDMDEHGEMKADALKVAVEACEMHAKEKDVSKCIKQLFDSKYGPTWHCIVGADFRSYVTHESKHFIFFYHGKLAICLYKCG